MSEEATELLEGEIDRLDALLTEPEGSPIAVHVMDGAFLVSFDGAVKKAYTSVAVKMSAMVLSHLVQLGAPSMVWTKWKAETS